MADDDDKGRPRVTLLPGGQIGPMFTEKQTQEMIELQPMFAKILRAKFIALKREGFTDEQALELCKKLTV